MGSTFCTARELYLPPRGGSVVDVITKDEFAKIVKRMQDAGRPVTVRNLMIETELPRATVEEWLEDVQGNAGLVPKAEPKKVEADEPSKKKKVKEKSKDDDESIFSRASALKDQVVGDVVKSQLGLKEESAASKGEDKKSIATGAILGAVFPPAAFAYAAPLLEGILASVIYIVIAGATYYIDKLPFIGKIFTTPVLLITHLLGLVMGLAYAFRYNRNGKRMPLLPKSSKGEEE